MEDINIGTSQEYIFNFKDEITISPEIKLGKITNEFISIIMPEKPGIYYAIKINGMVVYKFIVSYVLDDAVVYIHAGYVVGYEYMGKFMSSKGCFDQRCSKYKNKN